MAGSPLPNLISTNRKNWLADFINFPSKRLEQWSGEIHHAKRKNLDIQRNS